MFKSTLALVWGRIWIHFLWNWWLSIPCVVTRAINLEICLFYDQNFIAKLMQALNNLPRLFIHAFFRRITAKHGKLLLICLNRLLELSFDPWMLSNCHLNALLGQKQWQLSSILVKPDQICWIWLQQQEKSTICASSTSCFVSLEY